MRMLVRVCESLGCWVVLTAKPWALSPNAHHRQHFRSTRRLALFSTPLFCALRLRLRPLRRSPLTRASPSSSSTSSSCSSSVPLRSSSWIVLCFLRLQPPFPAFAVRHCLFPSLTIHHLPFVLPSAPPRLGAHHGNSSPRRARAE